MSLSECLKFDPSALQELWSRQWTGNGSLHGISGILRQLQNIIDIQDLIGYKFLTREPTLVCLIRRSSIKITHNCLPVLSKLSNIPFKWPQWDVDDDL